MRVFDRRRTLIGSVLLVFCLFVLNAEDDSRDEKCVELGFIGRSFTDASGYKETKSAYTAEYNYSIYMNYVMLRMGAIGAYEANSDIGDAARKKTGSSSKNNVFNLNNFDFYLALGFNIEPENIPFGFFGFGKLYGLGLISDLMKSDTSPNAFTTIQQINLYRPFAFGAGMNCFLTRYLGFRLSAEIPFDTKNNMNGYKVSGAFIVQ